MSSSRPRRSSARSRPDPCARSRSPGSPTRGCRRCERCVRPSPPRSSSRTTRPSGRRTGRTGWRRPSGCSARPGLRARVCSPCSSHPSACPRSSPLRLRPAPRPCSTGSCALYGERARVPGALLERAWGVDPFTRGYITSWAPGDVSRVGPLHGTHEPPFYVAGSDHWVAGYMEGAVRTGRAAARAALAPARRSDRGPRAIRRLQASPRVRRRRRAGRARSEPPSRRSAP